MYEILILLALYMNNYLYFYLIRHTMGKLLHVVNDMLNLYYYLMWEIIVGAE